ncbi:MAG: hypothetical protein ACLRYY_13570 [Anaerobutyricum soehngenii]
MRTKIKGANRGTIDQRDRQQEKSRRQKPWHGNLSMKKQSREKLYAQTRQKTVEVAVEEKSAL